jgi:hypothetical protein
VVGQHPGTSLEFIPSNDTIFSDEIGTFVGQMSAAAQRSLNWNLLNVRPGPREREGLMSRLRISDRAAEVGGRVYGLTMPEPSKLRLTFLSALLYDTLPDWAEVMHLPVPERIAALAKPGVRHMLREGAASATYRLWTDCANCTVSDVERPHLFAVVDSRTGDLVPEWGTDASTHYQHRCPRRAGTGITTPASGDDDESWAERGASVLTGAPSSWDPMPAPIST